MRSNIIKKGTADEVRCAVTELRLSETFMDVPQLSVKVVSSTPITFEIGDYITYDYNGVTYTLRSIPEAAKNARPSTYGGAFVYNLVFYSPMWDLRNAPFLDLVLYDNGQHFTSMPDVTTYEDVYGIAARVQANMDNMYPGKWEIRVVSGLSADSTLAQKLSETQDFSLSDGKCLDALSQVYSQWGVSFVYSYEGGKHVITIGGAETQEDTTGLFMYGRGNGLKVIKSSVQNASEIATRYYVYGGTQNMQPRYYNGRTMEPEYIHASDASNPTVTAICSGRRLLGDNMYVPNLMIPVSKWGRTTWYVWTASSHSQAVFTEVRNPSAGDDFAFDEPNIGASRNVISSVDSDSIVVGGVTYQYLTEVLYPDIRKAYIDAPQSYLDKYGIRPATLRFDGSGEREDIHPSIKGLTIGDIRAGLGSGAEYYPSASVYTDPDERIDKVLSCDNPQDDGLTSSGANKYESSSSIAVAAVEKEFELALSNRAGNKIYTLGGRGSYYVLSEGAQFQVQYDGVLNARIPIQFSLATEGRDDRIHCRAGVKVNKTTSSGVESVIGSSVDEKAVVDLSTIDMDLSVDISGVSVQSGDTISVDIELYTLTTKSHDKVTVNIEAFTARYNIAISLGTDFYIKLKQIGFDISEVPTNDGESPVISMTSGQCGGYEFEIHDVSYNASDDSWTLRCARVQDGTLGQWFPNSIFKIEPDDTFVLLNIALPEVYITANEQRLYDAALAERLYEERPLLEPEIDSKVMAESPQVLRAGMWFSVKDTDLGLAGADGGSYLILIDSVEVTDKPDTIRSFKVTLRNNKEDNVFVRMQRQIAQTSASVQSERRSQTKTSVSEVPTKGGGGDGYIDTSDFVTLSTEQTITAPKTFANDVIFGAAKEDGSYSRLLIPSTSGPGIYSLCISTQPVSGETPSGSGGIDEDELWSILGGSSTSKVIAIEHIPSIPVEKVSGLSTALSSYATQTWVQSQGYLTSVGVSDIGGLGEGWTPLLGSAPDFYSRSQVYSKSESDGRYVGIANEQTVSGRKTFSALLTASAGISSTDADFSGYVSASRLYVPFSGNNRKYSLLISTSPVGGEVPSGSGGIDETELWAILTDGAGGERIAKAHLPSDAVYQSALSSYALKTEIPSLDGYATQEWVEGKGYLTSVSLSTISDLHSSWDAQLKAAPTEYVTRWPSFSEVSGTPTTLEGYGITDAYTMSEMTELLGGYVTIAGEQTISGAKTFTSALTKFNAVSGTDADFSGCVSSSKLYVPFSGNNRKYFISVVTAPVGGEAPDAGLGIDEDELWSILGGSSTSKVIAIEHIPSIPTSKITGLDNALSGYVSSVTASGAGNAVTGYAKSGNTLTLKKDLTFLTSVPKATSSAYGGIKIGYPESGKNYPVELDSSGRAYVSVPWTDTNTNTTYTLTKSGSTITLTGSDGSKTSVTDSNTTYSLSSFGITATAEEINKLDGVGTLLHSGNYTSYTYPTTVAKISDLHSSWDSILTTSGVRSRSMTFNGTDYPCYTAAANTSDITWYAPTTAGASGQWLKSTGGTPVWANDGSGSGLDADLLDGYHQSSFLRSRNANNVDFNTVTESGVYRLSYTTSNGASNGPSGIEWGNMLVLRGGGDTIAQLAFGYTSSARPKYRQGNPSNVGGVGSWTQWFTLATTLDNVYSATKLQTSRTLWGQSFNGTGNVSGALTGVTSITASTYIKAANFAGTYISDNRVNYWVGNAADGAGSSKTGLLLYAYGSRNIYLYTNGEQRMVVNASGNVGIGVTSPSYKLDVAGTLRATGQGTFDTIKITDNTPAAHITFGRTDQFNYISMPGDSSTLAIAPGGDISGAGSALCISNSATYPGHHNGTISLGTSSYRWSNVYSVLGSFSGLLTADSIAVTDKLYFPSPDGNQRYYIKFE